MKCIDGFFLPGFEFHTAESSLIRSFSGLLSVLLRLIFHVNLCIALHIFIYFIFVSGNLRGVVLLLKL